MITIVSGLPRSGTSLMMQMLAAGGMPILTDGKRQPDTDNPRGYYEWEKIKELPRQPECIGQAEGKAVKVISQLLFGLPLSNQYRIIYMQRPLDEVLGSQQDMIRRRNSIGPAVSANALATAVQRHVNLVEHWLAVDSRQEVLRIHYHNILCKPLQTSELVAKFVQLPLNAAAMAIQVDTTLYRHRGSQPREMRTASKAGI